MNAPSADDTQPKALLAQLDELLAAGQLAGVIDGWRAERAAELLRTAAALLNRRGMEHFAQDRLAAALTCFTLALRAEPTDAAALNNAATCLKEQGRLADSTALYRRAVELQPGFTAAHSNLLMNLQYQDGMTPARLAAAQREWDVRHAQPLRPATRPQTVRDPAKPLRIGLVSPDLGQHPVGIFLVRFLEGIDRAQFQFISYANGRREGLVADRIRAVTVTHDVAMLDDTALAAQITADGIDILIDLCGHTAANRLGVFARQPAPVQIGWLGYPGDNGLTALDYVIGDPQVLPLTMQADCAARIAQLPDCFVCFDPPAAAPPVTPLPATMPGRVTFGYFGNPAKCGAAVIGLWAAILRRLPQARLRLKYKGFGDAACQQDFSARFAAHGIDPARLVFAGASPEAAMFTAIQAVDLALDPFPFTGGLMACLTLWLGVPVLTAARRHFRQPPRSQLSDRPRHDRHAGRQPPRLY